MITLFLISFLASTATAANTAGFALGNGTFLLDGSPIRLFAGSVQHFRIHPNHWQHRLKLAKYMGLNAVQTLIPWFLMEPTPGAFITDGFADIVQFSRLCASLDLKLILRPGPFICDGPDFGGLPWWLAQQGTPATTLPERPGWRLRVRTSDPAYMRRVRLFYTKLFALLRDAKLTADLGGPIIMAQIENEYGSYGSDKVYLAQLRDLWRKGLGPGVVIHSTDGPSEQMLLGTKLEGVLNTIDGQPNFALLRQIQPVRQPLMNSEVYTGGLAYWGGDRFPITNDNAAAVDAMLGQKDAAGAAYNASFTLWLFAGVTDFGFQGGSTGGSGTAQYLTPSYDFGAPVTESGALRPLYTKLQQVLAKHGAVVGSGPPPPQPPVTAFPPITMTQALPLLDDDVLAALSPHPISSGTPRGMEELGVGYGFVLYSAPLPEPQASNPNVAIALAGMHDRALVMVGGLPRLVCDGAMMTCGESACVPTERPTAPWSARASLPARVDVLVENRGRSCYGDGMQLPTTGIDRWVKADGQILPSYTIYPLGAMANVSAALAPLWRQAEGNSSVTPHFFRGTFSIATGKLADTYVDMRGWGKGMVYVNGHALARYYDVGPQYTHYCPAGFLREGSNEVLIFETMKPHTNRTVSFMTEHLVIGSEW